MKTIGLIGGMSWESTADYYREINQGVKESLGGLHSAKLVLYSVDFDPIERLQNAGDWAGAGAILGQAAQSVNAAGADFFLLCTNTMHKVASEVESAAGIPLLHIADATAEALLHDGIQTVGLLGTRYTMEQEFYKGRLQEKFGLKVLVPGQADRDVVYEELCLGRTLDSSRAEYLRIIEILAVQGAQAVILGCTEIGLLVKQADTSVRLYDTTRIHARKAVERALAV